MSAEVSRRELLAAVAAVGVGGAAFQRAAVAAAAQPKVEAVTPEMVQSAEWVAGITLTEPERKAVAAALTNTLRTVAALNNLPISNAVGPAVHFTAVPGEPPSKGGRGTVELNRKPEGVNKLDGDDLAFAPLADLAEQVRHKLVSSTELTKLYLARLKKYDPALLCVVSLTEEVALKQAAEADKEIAAGKYRGPLHGIPWAAKDLIAYPGHPTTWGAGHFKEQTFEERATVAARLDAAGAVLACKTTLGALAWGDVWFGGTTRNPWNIKQGSSGSSAGTASAVAAGLVGFGLGSETHGSIVSPSTRCGVTGLRPTFGRVSRHGCMALCWSLDKVGPMCRSAEDCALVLGAIHGFDGKDPTAQDRPFDWPAKTDLKELRVGFVEGRSGGLSDDDRKVLAGLGVKLVPITLPAGPAGALMSMILDVESAAAFDDITREGVKENIGLWPNTFRRGRFVSAVDYLRAQRARTRLMREMTQVFEKVDLYANGNDLALTNLTGHPTVCLPNGFTKAGTPTALTFTGKLFGEGALLTVAKAYQDATGHRKRPPQDAWVPEKKGDTKDESAGTVHPLR
ncbi:amidase [Gemmata sp. JC673]|uniref:Amidase n=1 Tax=Gemmata algarum TaxID=2975278 RepID=A0ABU5EX67_9BACT|nr:amidase [Gemmata algarum]MDY3559065.1 amidase [Gemmata algarum]